MGYKRVIGNRKEIKKLYFATDDNILKQHKKFYKCDCNWCIASKTLNKYSLSDKEIEQILQTELE